MEDLLERSRLAIATNLCPRTQHTEPRPKRRERVALFSERRLDPLEIDFWETRGSQAGWSGRSWLTVDDRWSNDPREAEILEDEAHATIRLIDGQMLSLQGQSVRLVELEASADLA